MIIDTNVYSNAARNNSSATAIFNNNQEIYIPVFVVAELEFGFNNGDHTVKNRERLYRFLSEAGVNIIIPTLETAVVYAELALYAKKSGRVLSNNDIWIAALALENNMKLVTFDKDFDVFTDKLGDQLVILDM